MPCLLRFNWFLSQPHLISLMTVYQKLELNKLTVSLRSPAANVND